MVHPHSFSHSVVLNMSRQDIAIYLIKINNVPASYNIGKLCTEDPISVSRKFSLKFHAFFKTVLLKGEVLGTVEHFYWKKSTKHVVLHTTMYCCGSKMHPALVEITLM